MINDILTGFYLKFRKMIKKMTQLNFEVVYFIMKWGTKEKRIWNMTE